MNQLEARVEGSKRQRVEGFALTELTPFIDNDGPSPYAPKERPV
jgi:hypothetical protein